MYFMQAQYHIVSLFRLTKLLFFSVLQASGTKIKRRKSDIKAGAVVLYMHQNENETDEVGFSHKAQKFGHTKETRYTVYNHLLSAITINSTIVCRDQTQGHSKGVWSLPWSTGLTYTNTQHKEKENLLETQGGTK